MTPTSKSWAELIGRSLGAPSPGSWRPTGNSLRTIHLYPLSPFSYVVGGHFKNAYDIDMVCDMLLSQIRCFNYMFSEYTEDLLHDTSGLPISCGPSSFMSPAYGSTVLCSGLRIDYLVNLRGASFKALPEEQLTLRQIYCSNF